MSTTILCVQDDRHLCQIHERALFDAGYRVISAHDGEQALAHARDDGPDLALLDVLLPKRDGFEVLEAIRQQPGREGQVPVLLLSSGRVSPAFRERADDLGSVSFLSKPVPLDLLLGRVRELVQPASGARPSAEPPAGRLRGSLRDVDFAALLHQIHGERCNGVLLLENGKKKKAIQFADGYPIAVRSNLVTECLGNMLVESGRIDEGALRESIQRVKKGEGLQGEILVAMELIDEDSLAAVLREQAELKLLEIFQWRRGSFELRTGRKLQRAATLAVDCSPADLVVRGARDHVPLERIDAYLAAHAASYPARCESPFCRFQDVELRPEEERLISQLDGCRRLGEFGEASESTRRAFYGLLMTELVELRERSAPDAPQRPASETPERSPVSTAPTGAPEDEAALRLELTELAGRMRGRSNYEVLGIPTTADDEAVRLAYEALAVRLHPDRFRNAGSAVRQLAGELERLVSRAREALANVESRASYAEVLSKSGARERRENERGRKALAAETAFQQGEAAMRRRDYEDALLFFGRALERFPEEGEYHAHYGWCLHLCHPDNAVILEEAIEHVRRGVALAREREKPYLFLGRLYKVLGKTAAAEKMFTRAVQIRPDCVEAMRELRLMNMRREKGRGILGRLLRR